MQTYYPMHMALQWSSSVFWDSTGPFWLIPPHNTKTIKPITVPSERKKEMPAQRNPRETEKAKAGGWQAPGADTRVL